MLLSWFFYVHHYPQKWMSFNTISISYKWVSLPNCCKQQEVLWIFFCSIVRQIWIPHSHQIYKFIKLLFIGTLTTHHNDIEFLFYFSCKIVCGYDDYSLFNSFFLLIDRLVWNLSNLSNHSKVHFSLLFFLGNKFLSVKGNKNWRFLRTAIIKIIIIFQSHKILRKIFTILFLLDRKFLCLTTTIARWRLKFNHCSRRRRGFVQAITRSRHFSFLSLSFIHSKNDIRVQHTYTWQNTLQVKKNYFKFSRHYCKGKLFFW